MFSKDFLPFIKRRLQVVGVMNILTKAISSRNNDSNVKEKRNGNFKKISSRNIPSI